jgi:hypothetical protein
MMSEGDYEDFGPEIANHNIVGETFEDKPSGTALAGSAWNRTNWNDIFFEKI